MTWKQMLIRRLVGTCPALAYITHHTPLFHMPPPAYTLYFVETHIQPEFVRTHIHPPQIHTICIA
jgi:hypothetical protein